MTYKHISNEDIVRRGKVLSRRIFSDSFGLYQHDIFPKSYFGDKEFEKYQNKMEKDGYEVRHSSIVCDGTGMITMQWIKYGAL